MGVEAKPLQVRADCVNIKLRSCIIISVLAVLIKQTTDDELKGWLGGLRKSKKVVS